ncbi:MAG TPA: glycosyltransferase family 2 protein [Anaeromyxobacter sp.]|nr:glycosyltransferase family 2 protein [Anaeromyxobacter sp.]
MITLSIVVPCFNEEQVLPETLARLGAVRAGLVSEQLVSAESAVWFVDDGSTDGTWRLVEEAAAANEWVRGIKLSRNRGHQNAILAGLFESGGSAVITVDADLQDDLSAIREMVVRHAEGAEIVYGVRSSRRSDSWFKRATAEGYYRLLRTFGVDVVFNHADYRLMGRRAIRALQEFAEVNLFLRGIVPQLGFRTDRVYYARAERFAGESKYPLRKMLSLAWDGITSYSTVPLRWITAVGTVVSLLSVSVGVWAFVVRLTNPASAPGWASTVVPFSLLGGIQLLSLGVVGEYVAKIYAETKHRPRYIVETTTPRAAARSGDLPLPAVEGRGRR